MSDPDLLFKEVNFFFDQTLLFPAEYNFTSEGTYVLHYYIEAGIHKN